MYSLGLWSYQWSVSGFPSVLSGARASTLRLEQQVAASVQSPLSHCQPAHQAVSKIPEAASPALFHQGRDSCCCGSHCASLRDKENTLVLMAFNLRPTQTTTHNLCRCCWLFILILALVAYTPLLLPKSDGKRPHAPLTACMAVPVAQVVPGIAKDTLISVLHHNQT